MLQKDVRYITILTPVSRFFFISVIRRDIMTSRKAWRFRAIFERNFLKIHTSFLKYWYISELSCDKKNLKWIFISDGIYETRCVVFMKLVLWFICKTNNSLHKYRMIWKFISDPIFLFPRKWKYLSPWSFVVCKWDLGYDVNKNDVTSHDVMLWRSFLYRMCE